MTRTSKKGFLPSQLCLLFENLPRTHFPSNLWKALFERTVLCTARHNNLNPHSFLFSCWSEKREGLIWYLFPYVLKMTCSILFCNTPPRHSWMWLVIDLFRCTQEFSTVIKPTKINQSMWTCRAHDTQHFPPTLFVTPPPYHKKWNLLRA